MGAAAGALGHSLIPVKAQQSLPNVVLINCDDLGFGDLGCYGSRARTPNIDRMASEGARFTSFYSASPICSPSRASLLTGRYGVRTGVAGVLGPDDESGLRSTETTMAAMLKRSGYRTSCIGKWHLGAKPQYLPTNRGFDEYFGIPYSNDMYPSILLRNTEIVEQPVNQETLTARYTEQAKQFIKGGGAPFFLYLAHHIPHIPLMPSRQFRGRSPLGSYGDVLEELDWSVGEVLNTLKSSGAGQNTLVLLTSDNGPWYQGSPGVLRGRKGDTFDGGSRVPFLAWMPGRIPSGQTEDGVATALDVAPTVASLTGAAPPPNRFDGVNIWPILSGAADSVNRDVFLFFNCWELQCARLGKWKLHLARYNVPPYAPAPPQGKLSLPLPRPELYDMENDPGESFDVAEANPDVVTEITARVESSMASMPELAQRVWRETKARQVEITPVGALPEPAPPQ